MFLRIKVKFDLVINIYIKYVEIKIILQLL